MNEELLKSKIIDILYSYVDYLSFRYKESTPLLYEDRLEYLADKIIDGIKK